MHSWDKPCVGPKLKRNQGYMSSTYAQERTNLWAFSKFDHNYKS